MPYVFFRNILSFRSNSLILISSFLYLLYSSSGNINNVYVSYILTNDIFLVGTQYSFAKASWRLNKKTFKIRYI